MKKIMSFFLVVVMVMSLAACGSSETSSATTEIESSESEDIVSEEEPKMEPEEESEEEIPVEEEPEPEFDLDAYEAAVADCAYLISENCLYLYNVILYINNYWESYNKITSGTPSELTEKGFDWLEERTYATRDSISEAKDTISEQYKELIITEIEGKEAEEVDAAIRDLFSAHEALYSLVMNPGTSRDSFISDYNDAYNTYTNSMTTLSLFMDIPKAEVEEREDVEDDSEEEATLEDADSEETVSDESSEDELVADAKPVQKVETFSAGMYLVGTDIPAGTYWAKQTGNTGLYVAIYSDSTGENIIDNDSSQFSVFLTVRDGEYVEAKRCTLYHVEDATPPEPIDGVYQTGVYRVGIDIPAGEYLLTVDDPDTRGYWQRSYEYIGSESDIIANKNFEGTAYVTVQDGEYFVVKRATFVATG